MADDQIHLNEHNSAAGQTVTNAAFTGASAAPSNAARPNVHINSTTGVQDAYWPAGGPAWVPLTSPASGGGNIVALASKAASNTAVVIDPANTIQMRWNGTTDRFEASTTSGTKSIEYVTAINYGSQAAVINGGAGVDSSLQGTPLALTTAWQSIGDLGIVGIEHRVFHLFDGATHYVVTAVRKGTTTTDGWCDFTSQKIGLTSSTVVPVYTGATAGAGGVTGTVPIASAGQQAAVLRGDGVWVTPVRFRATNTGGSIPAIAVIGNGWVVSHNDGGGTFSVALGTFTVPRAGKYRLTASFFLANPNAIARLQILKNNVVQVSGISAGLTGTGMGVTVTDTINCASGDVLALQMSNGQATTYSGAPENVWIIDEQL
jgi:hypothetical protein